MSQYANRYVSFLKSPWLPLCMIAALTVLCVGRSTVPRVTSDPSAYLNYGKLIAEGRLFFDFPAARFVHEKGGAFEDSAFHGYIRANREGRLYPYVGAGFPLILAAVIRGFGQACATWTNVALLPLFLLVFAWFIRTLIPGDKPALRYWVPVLSLACIFSAFLPHMASWSLIYRELPSTLLALAGLAVVARPVAGEGGRSALVRPLLAGILLGLAVGVRETAVLMALPGGMMAVGGIRNMLRRGTASKAWLAGLVFGAGVLAGYSPQAAVNIMQRGRFTDEQVTASTENLLRSQINSDGGEVNAGFTVRNLRRFLPERLIVQKRMLGAWLPVALIGAGLCGFRRYRALGCATLIPGACYTLLYSAFDYPPGNLRYELMILLFAVPLAALGVAYPVVELGANRLLRLRSVRSAALGAAVLLILTPGVIREMRADPAKKPSIADLRRFQTELDKFIPRGTTVLCEFPARDYLQYFSRGTSVSLFSLQEAGFSAGEFVAWCRDSGSALVFFRSENRELTSVPYGIDEIAGMLEGEADLTPIHRFDLAGFGLAGTFGQDTAMLYSVRPLICSNMAARIDVPYADPCRLYVDLRKWPCSELPAVTVDGLPVELLRLGESLLAGRLPPILPTDSISVNLSSARTLSRRLRLSVCAVQEPFAVPFGTDGADLRFLGREWLRGRWPTYRGGSRRMPGRSTLDLGALIPVTGESADVFIGILPMKSADLRVQAEGRGAITCLDGNGLAVGIVIPACPPAAPLRIENATDDTVFVKHILAGHVTNSLAIPCPRTGDRRVIRGVIAVPGDTTRPAVRFPVNSFRGYDGREDPAIPIPEGVISVSRSEAGGIKLTASPGFELMLAEPGAYECPSGKWTLKGDDRQSGAIMASGFHAVERGGRWTRGRARILLPPDLTQNGGIVSVVCRDHRPPGTPPIPLTIETEGAVLAQTNLTGRAAIGAEIGPMTDRGCYPRALELVSPTWIPAEVCPGNRDSRQLGVFVESISFEPFDSSRPGKSRSVL